MDHDKILQFIKAKGPILPVQLASELKENMIIAGAVLSELAASKKILISNTKVGGSPVYYLIEQKFKLQDLYKYLNEKDKRAYDLLKQKKLLRDVSLTPLLRVSLRNIKDFARPVEVNHEQKKELFWRWYLTPMQDIEQAVKSFFDKPKPAEIKKKPVESKPEPPKQEKLTGQEVQKPEPAGDSLYDKTKRFFNQNNIKVINTEIIRKNTEIDYIIKVPSPIGELKYYCKAKSKKKSNDSDLAQAFVKGQVKKLPVLLLTTGEFTKKALESLNSDFDGMKIQKLR